MKGSNKKKLAALKLMKSEMKKVKGGAKEHFDRSKPHGG